MVGAFYAVGEKGFLKLVSRLREKLWSTTTTKLARRTQRKAGFFPCELCGSLCALCSTNSTTRRNDENHPAPREERKANCVYFRHPI